MHKVHGFARVLTTLNPLPAPALARSEAVHALALKRAGVAGRALRADAEIILSIRLRGSISSSSYWS